MKLVIAALLSLGYLVQSWANMPNMPSEVRACLHFERGETKLIPDSESTLKSFFDLIQSEDAPIQDANDVFVNLYYAHVTTSLEALQNDLDLVSQRQKYLIQYFYSGKIKPKSIRPTASWRKGGEYCDAEIRVLFSDNSGLPKRCHWLSGCVVKCYANGCIFR